MNKEQITKWKKYCQAEHDNIRSVLLVELEQFISLLLQSEPAEYKNWVYDLSAKVIDEDNNFPVRMPLFEKVILPILWDGCNNNVSGCARWLAGFNQQIYKSKSIQNILGKNFSEIYFLKLAIKHDPFDSLAKKKLILALASQLEYSIHEIPAGVLWGNDGASIHQCTLLKEELLDFKALVLDYGISEQYKELIEECFLHFTEYPKYLAQNKYDSYENYLSSIN